MQVDDREMDSHEMQFKFMWHWILTEFEWMWKKAVIAYFKVLPQNLEANREN